MDHYILHIKRSVLIIKLAIFIGRFVIRIMIEVFDHLLWYGWKLKKNNLEVSSMDTLSMILNPTDQSNILHEQAYI